MHEYFCVGRHEKMSDRVGSLQRSCCNSCRRRLLCAKPGGYPKFQAFFRERKPPTLILWGKNDQIFPPDGATPYLRDLPKAELHLFDTGHFALEEKADEMIPLIRKFLARNIDDK
jgi:pimeloyl-ACP methyl ester carboxylesterase